MKADVLDLGGKIAGKVELPLQFEEEYRPDLIKKVFLVIQGNRRQAYGASEDAGKMYSIKISKRRRNYRGCYGHGISRVPRKVMWRRGMQFGWAGALAPGTVGGRKAHPPKAERNWKREINKKENRKAIRRAIAATALKELFEDRITSNFPLIVVKGVEDINKTKRIIEILTSLGLGKELERVSEKIVRAGKGKKRGRRYKRKCGFLIVVSKECSLMKGADNLNCDVIEVDKLSVDDLSSGLKPRLVIWSEEAIKRLNDEKLFTGFKQIKKEKPVEKKVEKKEVKKVIEVKKPIKKVVKKEKK